MPSMAPRFSCASRAAVQPSRIKPSNPRIICREDMRASLWSFKRDPDRLQSSRGVAHLRCSGPHPDNSRNEPTLRTMLLPRVFVAAVDLSSRIWYGGERPSNRLNTFFGEGHHGCIESLLRAFHRAGAHCARVSRSVETRLFNFRIEPATGDSEKLDSPDLNHPRTEGVPAKEFSNRQILLWPAAGESQPERSGEPGPARGGQTVPAIAHARNRAYRASGRAGT